MDLPPQDGKIYLEHLGTTLDRLFEGKLSSACAQYNATLVKAKADNKNGKLTTPQYFTIQDAVLKAMQMVGCK